MNSPQPGRRRSGTASTGWEGEGPDGCGSRQVGTGQRDGRRDRGTAASRGRARPGVRGAGPGRAVAGGGRHRGAAGGRRWVPGRSGAPVPPRRYPACGEARPAAAALRHPRAAAAPRPAPARPVAEPLWGSGVGAGPAPWVRGRSHSAGAGGALAEPPSARQGQSLPAGQFGPGCPPPLPPPLPLRVCVCACAR